jgi:hypothetical protein
VKSHDFDCKELDRLQVFLDTSIFNEAGYVGLYANFDWLFLSIQLM